MFFSSVLATAELSAPSEIWQIVHMLYYPAQGGRVYSERRHEMRVILPALLGGPALWQQVEFTLHVGLEVIAIETAHLGVLEAHPAVVELALARFRLAPEQPCENDYIVDFIARHSLKEVDGGWTWKFDPSIWTSRFSIGDTAERLRATKCRIAIMRGEMSVLMPPEVGEYMFSLLGHAAPVIEIPQARHHVMLDQPLAFVAALRALLADWNHSMPTRRV